MSKMLSHLRVMDEVDLPWVWQTEQQAYDFPWSEKGFEQALKSGVNFVFCGMPFDEGGLNTELKLGYACLLPIVDELELLNFCVSPAYQGQGIGREALRHLIQRFENTHYQCIHLEVRISNTAAQKLYAQLGFKVVGRRPSYYRSFEGKEDAVLMTYSFASI